MRAFLGLGGNLGDPPRQFVQALALLDEAGARTVRRSSIYRTPPLGPPQPEYVNAVVEIETELEPAALLAEILRVEQRLGRKRDQRWGPRLVDIDILLFGATALSVPGLTIPHPGLASRAFVLVPLAELEPSALPAGMAQTVGELLASLSSEERSAVHRLDSGWPER
jgi:2-amino-4-hydroxy-6-hydroxymethyldihydropteridine diphosphokinase